MATRGRTHLKWVQASWDLEWPGICRVLVEVSQLWADSWGRDAAQWKVEVAPGSYIVCVSLSRLIISFCWAPRCQNTERCLLPLYSINHLFIWLKIMAAHLLLPVQLVVALPLLGRHPHSCAKAIQLPSPWQQPGRLKPPPASVHELKQQPHPSPPAWSSSHRHSFISTSTPSRRVPTITLGGSQAICHWWGRQHSRQASICFRSSGMSRCTMDCLLRELRSIDLGATS